PSGQGPGESSGPRPDPKVCPKCNTTQVDPLAKFCFQCGTPFGSAPPPRPGLTCFNCGTPIKKTDMFCPSCGLNTRLG
ncbi:MAG TPA: zinc ribbon domain-containing protein, partial [Acidobacteriota bacterium]|nr:zinc ribbon domain-containing protein [Acidobacteriota bacterium]